jgi:hypothetical protein
MLHQSAQHLGTAAAAARPAVACGAAAATVVNNGGSGKTQTHSTKVHIHEGCKTQQSTVAWSRCCKA